MKILAAILLPTLVGTLLAYNDGDSCTESVWRPYPGLYFDNLYYECIDGQLRLRMCDVEYNSEICPSTTSTTSTTTSPPETTTSSQSTTADSRSSTGKECVPTTEGNCVFVRNPQQPPSPVDNKDKTVDSGFRSQQPTPCRGQYYNPYCMLFNAQSAPAPKSEVAINIYRNPPKENQIKIVIH